MDGGAKFRSYFVFLSDHPAYFVQNCKPEKPCRLVPVTSATTDSYFSRLCIRMVVSNHAWSVSQWWLAACVVRWLTATTSDGGE